MDSKIDILIIGAGQAGLALAYHLKSSPLTYVLVERNPRIGDSWRNRYDSLTLFTPRSFSKLPGFTLSGDPDGYATRDEFANYLERYAQRFEFPIKLGIGIHKLEQIDSGFRATLDIGDLIICRSVVLATGAFQEPNIPTWAVEIDSQIEQFTTETYRNAEQVRGHRALVVGDGATGRDIALDLAKTHEVMLATGHPRRLMPERLLGQSTWWWLDKLGILRISGDTIIGRKIKEMDSFPARGNRIKDLQNHRIHILPKLVSIQGITACFANGFRTDIDTIIWATGYRDSSDWVMIPEVKDEVGNFIHGEGVSPVPNLYFIGRPWQRNRASAIIAGVGTDASILMDRIMNDLSVNNITHSIRQSKLTKQLEMI